MPFLISVLLLSFIKGSVAQSNCVHTGALIANSGNCICGNNAIQTALGTSLIPICTQKTPYCYINGVTQISSCSSMQGYYYTAVTQNDCESSGGLLIQTPEYCREAFNNGYNADRGAYCIDDASSEDPATVACKTGTVSQEPGFDETRPSGCYVDRFEPGAAARGNPNDLPLDILILNQNFESSAAYTATKVGLCQMPVGCSDTTGLFLNTEQCQCGSNLCLDDKLVCSPPGASWCLPEKTNAACSNIAAPTNQAACDPQSVGACAGGSGTDCTDITDGPEATCTGTYNGEGKPCTWTSTNLCTYSGGNVCGCRAGQYLDLVKESCEDCTGTEFSQAGTTTPGGMSRACNHNGLQIDKEDDSGRMDTPCPKGTWIDTNNNACLGCPSGWYSDKPGMYVCKQCANGGSSPAGSTSNSGCSGCALGYGYDIATDPKCSVCGAGHYSDQIGTAGCKKCSAGKFLSDARTNPTYPSKHDNEDDCAKCQEGTISDKDGGSDFCKACEVGQKQTDIDPTLFKYKCENCMAGRYQGASGSKICDPCPSGYSQPSNEGIGFCVPCGAGFYTDQEGLATCKDCAVGKAVRYNRSAPNVVCADCHTGTYQDQTGKSSCEDCPVGQHIAATGQIECKECVVGKVSRSPGNRACADCNTGTYQDQTGKSSCKDCLPGQIMAATSGLQINCTDCVVGKVSKRPGRTACVDCNTGTYQNAPGKSLCKNCLPGQIMAATSGLQIKCKDCVAGKVSLDSRLTACTDCKTGETTTIKGAAVCDKW